MRKGYHSGHDRATSRVQPVPMLPLLLMLVQEVPGPPGDDPVPVAPAVRDCRGDPDEIIVCARESDRLRPLPERPPEEILPQARVRVGRNRIVQARAEPGPIPTAPAPRLMVDFKVAF
jgi:hypothetical protein